MYFPHVCPIGSDAARRAAILLLGRLVAIHVRDLLGEGEAGVVARALERLAGREDDARAGDVGRDVEFLRRVDAAR